MLAPMDGISNGIFRSRICAIGGVDLVATEFIRVNRGGFAAPKSQRHAVPLQIQFMASDPLLLAAAIRTLQEQGELRRDDWLDLNAGCPSRRVNARGAGGSLLKSPAATLELLTAMRREHSGPLSLKMRLGYEHEREFEELLLMLRDSPLDFVTIHARTCVDAWGPRKPLAHLATAAAELPFPVIGNGDVWNAEDARRMLQEGGVRGIMCGRGAVANPYLFSDIRTMLEGNAPEQNHVRRRALLQFAHDLLLQYLEREQREEKAMTGCYKEFARLLSHNPLLGAAFFNKAKHLQSLQEMQQLFTSCGAEEVSLPAQLITQ